MTLLHQSVANPGRRGFGRAALVGMTSSLIGQGRVQAHESPLATVAPVSRLVRVARSVVPIPLVLSTGQPSNLAGLLQGQITAVQLFFTGCGSTCLTQGALFADLQQRLRQENACGRLLSLSIDPLNDDERTLTRWLNVFHADAAYWKAGVPALRGLDAMLREFRQNSTQDAVQHLNRVFLFDRDGRLFWISAVDPNADAIVYLMAHRT